MEFVVCFCAWSLVSGRQILHRRTEKNSLANESGMVYIKRGMAKSDDRYSFFRHSWKSGWVGQAARDRGRGGGSKIGKAQGIGRQGPTAQQGCSSSSPLTPERLWSISNFGCQTSQKVLSFTLG